MVHCVWCSLSCIYYSSNQKFVRSIKTDFIIFSYTTPYFFPHQAFFVSILGGNSCYLQSDFVALSKLKGTPLKYNLDFFSFIKPYEYSRCYSIPISFFIEASEYLQGFAIVKI